MFTGMIYSWFSSILFWFILAVLLVFITFGTLFFRKKGKLVYPCHIDTDLGGGKIGREITTAGWFKCKTMLFGLLDYGGEEVLKTKDGRIIQNASAEDFQELGTQLKLTRDKDGKVRSYQELGGKRGICCIRKGDDPAILLPIYKMSLTNGHLLETIAPAVYRDASTRIIKDSIEETRGKYDKLINAIVYGTIGIIFLICIIMIVQMVKTGQAEAGKFYLEAMKEAGKHAGSGAIASVAP